MVGRDVIIGIFVAVGAFFAVLFFLRGSPQELSTTPSKLTRDDSTATRLSAAPEDTAKETDPSAPKEKTIPAPAGAQKSAPGETGAKRAVASPSTGSSKSRAQKGPDSTGQRPVVSSIAPPNKPILFQPMLIWANSNPSHQGTGFFAKAPNGKVVAISSAHFLKRDGPPLLEVRWLDVRTNKPVATFTKSWGPPGNDGITEPYFDLRPDYLLMPVEGAVPQDFILELDTRPKPSLGERVWLPNKDGSAKLGYHLVSGRVADADTHFIGVILDQRIETHSQSGSPLISQATGKVIGTWSRGDNDTAKMAIWLTPAAAIRTALSKGKEFPLLREVIGKQALSVKERK